MLIVKNASSVRQFLTGVFLLWVTGMDTMPAQVADGNLPQGKALYVKHCALSHGAEGEGDGQFGQTVNPPAA